MGASSPTSSAEAKTGARERKPVKRAAMRFFIMLPPMVSLSRVVTPQVNHIIIKDD
jgi:hypothetical protein